MTDKHIIDKTKGETVKVEDARDPFMLMAEEIRRRRTVASKPVGTDDRPFDLHDVLEPVIETPRVVRAKFGAWRLDFDASEGATTLEHDGQVQELNVSTEDLADLARVLPAFLAKVVE